MYESKYYTPGSYEWMPHDDEDEIWELSRLMHLEYWHVCHVLGELEAGLIDRMQDVRYHIQRKGWNAANTSKLSKPPLASSPRGH